MSSTLRPARRMRNAFRRTITSDRSRCLRPRFRASLRLAVVLALSVGGVPKRQAPFKSAIHGSSLRSQGRLSGRYDHTSELLGTGMRTLFATVGRREVPHYRRPPTSMMMCRTCPLALDLRPHFRPSEAAWRCNRRCRSARCEAA